MLTKLRFQYLLSVACYQDTKIIIDCVSAIAIDYMTNILS